MAKQNQVDGIITVTYSDIESYISNSIPLISIDRFFNDNIPYVSSDNFSGGALAAKHLDDVGCQSVCFIGHGSKKDNATRNRRKGFVDYCERHQKSYLIFDDQGHHETFQRFQKMFRLLVLMELNLQQRMKLKLQRFVSRLKKSLK